MNFNDLGGIIWISLPIILIYYRKILYNKYTSLFYILSILSILLIPWLLMMLFILKGKTNKKYEGFLNEVGSPINISNNLSLTNDSECNPSPPSPPAYCNSDFCKNKTPIVNCLNKHYDKNGCISSYVRIDDFNYECLYDSYGICTQNKTHLNTNSDCSICKQLKKEL